MATDDVLSFFQVSLSLLFLIQASLLQLLPFFRHKMAVTFLSCIMTPFYLSSPSSWTSKQPSPILCQFITTALATLFSLVGSEHYTASSGCLVGFSCVVRPLGIFAPGMSQEAAEAQGVDTIYYNGTLALANGLVDFFLNVSNNEGGGYSETLAMRQFRLRVQRNMKMDTTELRSRRRR